MPTPRRDPYVAVDATIRKNAKLAALPSDSARLGWIYVGLGEAKLQRPAGRFASRAHWEEVAGRFGKYLRDYLAVCLIEEAPRLCDRCRQAWGQLPAGTLVVHDWRRHQSDPGAADRAAAYRAAHVDDDGGSGGYDPPDRTPHRRTSHADRTPQRGLSNGDQTGHERSLTRADARSRGTPRGESEEEEELEGEGRINETVEVPDAHAPSAEESNGLVDPSKKREEAVPWL